MANAGLSVCPPWISGAEHPGAANKFLLKVTGSHWDTFTGYRCPPCLPSTPTPPPLHTCQEEETTVHHCLRGPGGRGPWIEQLHALHVHPHGSRCQSNQRCLNLTRGEGQYYVWAHQVISGVWTPTASWGLSLCALWGPGRATPTAGLRKPESEGLWRPPASCPTTPFLKRVHRGLQRLPPSPRPSGLPIYTGTSDGNLRQQPPEHWGEMRNSYKLPRTRGRFSQSLRAPEWSNRRPHLRENHLEPEMNTETLSKRGVFGGK